MASRKHIPRELRVRVSEKTNGRCWYCGTRQSRSTLDVLGPLHIDHQIPISKGGKDTYENLVLACNKCNGHKNKNTLEKARFLYAQSQAESLESITEWLSLFHQWRPSPGDEVARIQMLQCVAYFLTCGINFYGETLGKEWSDYCI